MSTAQSFKVITTLATLESLNQGYTKYGGQVTQTTEFCVVASDILWVLSMDLASRHPSSA